MNDLRNRVRPDWAASLRGVLERAGISGEAGILAFDLDSTLFDNRPRQARIVREYGAARGIPELEGARSEDFDSGWDLLGALRNRGLSEERAQALYPDLKAFWSERFFTSEYCADDVPVEGAAGFLEAVLRTGARVCYLTGRHEGMRAGTVEALRKGGLPVPRENGGPSRVTLIMKPTLTEGDDTFKRQAHARLAEMGTLVAAFDNEPTHANDYRRNFPEATVIHLATDHSGRPVELLDGVISVPHFAHA